MKCRRLFKLYPMDYGNVKKCIGYQSCKNLEVYFVLVKRLSFIRTQTNIPEYQQDYHKNTETKYGSWYFMKCLF